MWFKKIRLWTMTESGNLSVKTTRHPEQESFEWCKRGWRIFSSSGSRACHSDLSFVSVRCGLNFFLLKCHKRDCVHKLKYITTSIHTTVWKICLFVGLKKSLWTVLINHTNCLSLAVIFIRSCFFYSDALSDSNPTPPIRERSNCVQIYPDLITCRGPKSLLIC